MRGKKNRILGLVFLRNVDYVIIKAINCLLYSFSSQSGYSYRLVVIRTIARCNRPTKQSPIVGYSFVHRLADHRFLEKCDFYFSRESCLRSIRRTDGSTCTGTVYFTRNELEMRHVSLKQK